MRGKPARVPYLKGGFEIEGLPEDLSFKKPFMYGRKQIRRIMEVKDGIIFHAKETSAAATTTLETSVDDTQKNTEQDDILRTALQKIVGRDIARNSLEGKHLIKEDEVEVLNLVLTSSENWIVQTCGIKYFEPDAWFCFWKKSDSSSF